jgi:hypothetical protein
MIYHRKVSGGAVSHVGTTRDKWAERLLILFCSLSNYFYFRHDVQKVRKDRIRYIMQITNLFEGSFRLVKFSF